MRKKKTIQAMVHGGLNNILRTSRDIGKEWGLKHIPLITFREIVDKGKLNMQNETIDIMKFQKEYNNTLDAIFTTCKNQSDKLKTDNVSVTFIKICVDHVKANMGI